MHTENTNKITSYCTYSAIVERKTIKILTFHYGIPKQFFAELFDVNKIKSVESEISKVLKGNTMY